MSIEPILPYVRQFESPHCAAVAQSHEAKPIVYLGLRTLAPLYESSMLESLQHFFSSVDWACWGVWTLTTVLMLVGLAGSVLPLVPGPLLIFIAAVLHFFLRPESGVSWWGLALQLGLTLTAYGLDFASGAMGTHWFGGSRWGIAGVLIGGIVGLFFGLPGLIIGPLAGGFLFEMLLAKKEFKPAVRSTWGTVVGTGMGLVLRLLLSIAMIVCFLLDVFWR